jgi:lipopolysaccharide export LptBFGC system permease protein LptF
LVAEERAERPNAEMKPALLFVCYFAMITTLCMGFAASNPLHAVYALLAISATALFAALILAVWQDLHPRR